VRAEPIGVLLSAPLCKLLVGQPDLITWKDLANVLPALQFGVLVACLDANLTAEEQQAKFAYFVEHGLGIDEGDGEVATFDAQSRDARRWDEANPGRAPPTGLRRRSVLEDEGETKPITLGNVGAFAAAWAQKELVINTHDQLAAVLHGLGDILGAQKMLASVGASGGWQALQRQVRGAADIDTAEWRSITTHQLGSGGQDAAAAADLFWELVAKLPASSRIKLLHFWCSEVPPAGGVAGLGEGSEHPLVLRFKPTATFNDGRQVKPLPDAHTCFHQLILTATTQQEEMQELLDYAVAQWNLFDNV
jgi:hypothetical protein